MAKPMVNTASRIPLIVKESAVPIFSAKVPNGTALNGIIPKVIMVMLIVRPRIFGSDLICTIVMFSDIYIELVKPINIRNGTAIAKEVSCANIAKPIPQASEAPSMTIPLLGMFPIEARRSVPIVAPMPISINKIPKTIIPITPNIQLIELLRMTKKTTANRMNVAPSFQIRI